MVKFYLDTAIIWLLNLVSFFIPDLPTIQTGSERKNVKFNDPWNEKKKKHIKSRPPQISIPTRKVRAAKWWSIDWSNQYSSDFHQGHLQESRKDVNFKKLILWHPRSFKGKRVDLTSQTDRPVESHEVWSIWSIANVAESCFGGRLFTILICMYERGLTSRLSICLFLSVLPLYTSHLSPLANMGTISHPKTFLASSPVDLISLFATSSQARWVADTWASLSKLCTHFVSLAMCDVVMNFTGHRIWHLKQRACPKKTSQVAYSQLATPETSGIPVTYMQTRFAQFYVCSSLSTTMTITRPDFEYLRPSPYPT